MAYSELVKNFARIRDYMRQFYVFGFRTRSEYTRQSTRSYDNERRRIESWLGKYMGFRQDGQGRSVFLSVDSRSIPRNPLYAAFKAKSFTAGDVTFYFYVLDLLREGRQLTVRQILEELSSAYLSQFDGTWEPDVSTIRKKLREYVDMGILGMERRGREQVFFLLPEQVDLQGWEEAVAFFSETDPMGVIGSFVLDHLDSDAAPFRFKHHYILHALDSQIMLPLLTAMGRRQRVTVTNVSPRSKAERGVHPVYPLRICVSTQSGRQYLLCYHYGQKKMVFYRLDYISTVTPGETEPNPERIEAWCRRFLRHVWGMSGGEGRRVDHLEMTVCYRPDEDYIPQRLRRERRNGTVEILGEGLCRYSVDTYDALELMPWIRTFLGRITELKCTNPAVERRFQETLELMTAMYEEERHAVF